MEIKIKINWHYIGEFFLCFLAFSFLAGATCFMGIVAGATHDSVGVLILLIMFPLLIGSEVAMFTASRAPKITPDNRWTIRGLRVALRKYSDYQPTDIYAIIEENATPQNKNNNRLVSLVSRKEQ